MAGLHTTLRPTSASSSLASQVFNSRVLLILTILPLTLAAFAFVLQWKGGIDDPTTRWSADKLEFPGMVGSGTDHQPSSSDCVDVLGRSRTASFPYFRDWKFGYGSNIMPKETGMDWIIHLDTDELIYPGGALEYSMSQLLSDVPSNVDICFSKL